MKDKPRQTQKPGALMLAGMLMLSGCTGNSAGGSVDTMRQIVAGGQQPAQLAAQSTPAQVVPTETPDFNNAQPALQVQPAAQPTGNPTPQPAAIAAGIDESAQPCPARYWRKGRCTATAAQLAAYTQQGGK